MAVIYVSAMETEVPDRARFDTKALELLDRLSREHRVFWNKGWREYHQIEKDIEACDALLAIVDSTWTSSTWMASEVTWALGGSGAIQTGNPKKPIPVFLFPVDAERLGAGLFPFGLPGTRVLDRDVTRAIEQINGAIESELA